MDAGYLEHVLVLCGIQAIAALGFYVTFLSGQFSAAHAAMMGIGAYVAGLLTLRAGVPLPAAMLTAALASSFIAAALCTALKRLSGMIFAIATLAFAEVVIVMLKNSPSVGGALGLSGVALETTLWHVLGLLGLLVLVFLRFEGSALAASMRAVRDDPRAAASNGIDVMRVRILAFALGGFLCGLAGSLQIHYLGVMEPDELGFYMTVALLLYTVVGGRDYFLGSILGAFAFTALPELLRVTSRGRLLVFSLILVLIAIARPEGLIRRPVFWRQKKQTEPPKAPGESGSLAVDTHGEVTK